MVSSGKTNFPRRRQRRNLAEYRQTHSFGERLFATDTIIQNFRSEPEEDCQGQSYSDRTQGKLEAIGERRLVRQTGRIDDPELRSLLLSFQAGRQLGLFLLGEQFDVFLLHIAEIAHHVAHLSFHRRVAFRRAW